MKLKPDQRQALRDALLKALPEEGDLNELTLMVFGVPLAQVSRGAHLREDALRIITTAESNDQIDQLVQCAQKQKPDNIELKAFVAIHLYPVFSAQERQGLIDAARLGGFTHDVLRTCFRRSWPARGSSFMPASPGEDVLTRLVDELGDVPKQTDGSTPLLRFAALLQLQAEGTAAAPRLKQWLLDAVGKRGGDVQGLLQQVGQEPAEQGHTLYLLLRLEKASEGRCTVQAWLSRGEKAPMQSIHADDSPRELSSMGQLLTTLVEGISGDLEDADGRLFIEFMLPRELLCHAVERSELEQGQHKPLCGCKFPVVVRSWDRAYHPGLSKQVRPDWVRKWKDFLTQPPGGRQGAVVWEPDPGEVGQLFDRLIEVGVVCLALMSPQEGSAATGTELGDCIDSGTPVAVWGRTWPDGPEKSQEKIQRLLADLRDLPEEVRALRAEARRKGEGHVGHSLVLFWDNPNRLPPDAQRNRRLTLPTT